MDENLIVGNVSSTDGLSLDIVIRIRDEQGEASAVAKDVIDMFAHYIADYEDGGEEQFQEDPHGFIAGLRRNLGLA